MLKKYLNSPSLELNKLLLKLNFFEKLFVISLSLIFYWFLAKICVTLLI